MTRFANAIHLLYEWTWSLPLLGLIFLVGLYLTIRTRGLPFRYLFYAHKLAFTRSDKRAAGDISHFQALMTVLAGTIGIGSITGVATAIAIGGLGSMVWMWLAALLGMATKYGEAILAVKYRAIDSRGEMCGGPMYYLEKGLKMRWLGILFALFGALAAFGIGNLVQSNSVALALTAQIGLSPIWTGIVMMVCVGLALIGGIKSIGKVVAILVPAMAAFYLLGGLFIIAINIQAVPAAFAAMFTAAFSNSAAVGGFAGTTVMVAIQTGVSRGIFSSEAGLGSSPIASAAAKTDTPGRQALVAMCSVFITTGVVCTITGLVIALSGIFGEPGLSEKTLDGSVLALSAFDRLLPYGGLIVTIALFPFGYSTILSWAYYGEKCVEYLFGVKIIAAYRVIFTLVVIPGAILSLGLVWDLANVLNGLMAVPNLIALIGLAGVIAKETRFFEQLLKKEKADKV
ncbi:MAG: sodium:alanine symporter family protein [Chlamydiota bacterium]